ncbi:MAG: hypothetical protein KC996_03025 [Phycisphaerales bacterium]|nr:hypothetical protein [Phycisphaerales bacterium]
MPDNDNTPHRDMLRAFLAENDAPCPVCTYNLRGVELTNCPECDSPLTLSVGQGRIRQGIWLFACLAFAMGFGFDLVVGLMFLVAVIMTGAEDFGSVYMLISLCVLGGLCVLAMWLLVCHRQAWLRLERKIQRRWTIVIYFGVFLSHLAVPIGLFLLSLS